VIVLLGIGFLAGVVTAISPCVLPVLPILLAGGATGRKPLRIVTGLVAASSSSALRSLAARQARAAPAYATWRSRCSSSWPRLLVQGSLVDRAAIRPAFALRATAAGSARRLLGLVFVPCMVGVAAVTSSPRTTTSGGGRSC
jgi:hypothetical protein